MAATRSKQRTKAQPIEFEQRLVLNQYLLSLLGKSSFEELAAILKPAQEGLDEDNTTRFYYSLIGGLSRNIVKSGVWKEIKRRSVGGQPSGYPPRLVIHL